MSRPDAGDWVSVFGRTRVNSGEASTPTERLGAGQDVTINDLNMSAVQESRWLIIGNENKVPVEQRMELIESYDSVLGILIEDM